MRDIQWYPGHMTKARRMIAEQLKYIDVVMEIVDARAPYATRNPDFDDLFSQKKRIILLNKSDLADAQATKRWTAWYEQKGWTALACTATKRSWWKKLENTIAQATQDIREKAAKRGVQKTIRIMVAGIPNVGKSTLINSIAKTGSTTVGNRPGVTKGKQWVRISSHMELLDTPGMLWPKLDDQLSALYLAFLGSIRDGILDIEPLSTQLLLKLAEICPEGVQQRYKKWAPDLSEDEMLGAVCKSRGFLLSGGVYDTERAANTVLDEFRSGKMGMMTLEQPNDRISEA